MSGPIQEIQAILTSASQVATPNKAPSNYAELKQLAVQADYEDSINTLKELFNSNEDKAVLKAGFTALCQKRDKENVGTALHYAAIPESACNSLYWVIANKLFSPASLSDMLRVLVPSVKSVLQLDFEYELVDGKIKKPDEAYDNINVIIRVSALASMSLKGESSSILSQFCIEGDTMFLLDGLVNLPLVLHRKLKRQLDSEHPELSCSLYAYNPELKVLSDRIRVVENQGKTARDALKALMSELTLAGTRYTGSDKAASSVMPALQVFSAYRQSLPKGKDQELLALKGGSKTLGDVLAHIDRGDSIETAARNLQSILSLSENQSALSERCSFSEAEYHEINKQYGSKQSLSGAGCHPSITIPDALGKRLLSRLELSQADDFISTLINFPESQYDAVLTAMLQRYYTPDGVTLTKDRLNDILFVSFIFSPLPLASFIFTILISVVLVVSDRVSFTSSVRLKLLNTLESGALNESQIDAVITFFAKKKDTCVLSFLLRAAIVSGQKDRTEKILEIAGSEARLKLIQEKDTDGRNAVMSAALNGHSECLALLLKGIDSAGRLTLLQKKDKFDWNTVMYMARHWKKKCLALSLKGLDSGDRLTLILEKDEFGRNAVTCAAMHSAPALFYLLSFFEGNELLKLMQSLGSRKFSRLTLRNPSELLAQLSRVYPDNSHLSAVADTTDIKQALSQILTVNTTARCFGLCRPLFSSHIDSFVEEFESRDIGNYSDIMLMIEDALTGIAEQNKKELVPVDLTRDSVVKRLVRCYQAVNRSINLLSFHAEKQGDDTVNSMGMG